MPSRSLATLALMPRRTTYPMKKVGQALLIVGAVAVLGLSIW
jgi:hypothetical protein